jgi:hypothetical protein
VDEARLLAGILEHLCSKNIVDKRVSWDCLVKQSAKPGIRAFLTRAGRRGRRVFKHVAVAAVFLMSSLLMEMASYLYFEGLGSMRF